jgi:peptidyl-prolyl cis-trans isomerase D
MLQAIRDKAQGWIAWAIVILISIPFALWGIQEYLGVGGEPEVAVVNGEPITQRLLDQRTRDFRERLRSALGDGFSSDLIDEETLKPQVLEAMIQERVLGDAVYDWNLRISDAQARGFIASIPAFQRDGRFDQALYDAALRNRGMTPAGFEQSVRQELSVSQLQDGIQNSAFVTDHALAKQVRLIDETRDVSFARIPAAAYADRIVVTVEGLREFYDQNPDLFRTPEQVRLEYLVLDAETLGHFVEVDDAGLRQYFDDHRSEFVAPEERAMRHILIAVNAGADEATAEAASAEAVQVLERIRGGADFAELAAEFSDDPGSAANGGDLGWVERGVMVPEFEQAGFALEVGAVSEPVKTDFGYHLIQVTDLRGGSDATFEEMRDAVDASYRKFEAESLFFDYAERLAQAAYESSGSLTPAAEELGLEVQSTGWLTRDAELPEALSSPKVLNLAFSDDVLIERHNSELIEVGNQTAVVIRVAEYQPAGIRDFEANRDLIEESYRTQTMADAAADTGREMLDALRSGARSLSDAASTHAWQFSQQQGVTRNPSNLPPAVVESAFSLSPPAADGLAYTGVAAGNGDFFLVEVAAVNGGSLETIGVAERPILAEQQAGQRGLVEMDYLTRSLRSRADIEIKSLADED